MKISVVVTTYNHERYIAQCLESVLAQKGDFDLEIVVRDDGSTDGTGRIVGEFQAKHPGLITVLPGRSNLGITRNLQQCLRACSGEYIAVCEGDDYWTSAAKLQKQKAFLDARRDCTMCFSAIMIYREQRGTLRPLDQQVTLEKDSITIEDLIGCNYIANFSCCMYRSDVVRRIPEEFYDLYAVDWAFNIACARFGRIGFIPDRMSVYRIHAKGAWAGKSAIAQLTEVSRCINTYNEFFRYEYDALFTRQKQAVAAEIVSVRKARREAIARLPGRVVRKLVKLVRRQRPDAAGAEVTNVPYVR